MEITLYCTDSPKNKLNKNLENEVAKVYPIMLDEIDLLNPVFELKKINIENLEKVNYMYIPFFNRYYYVDKIEMLPNTNVRITGSVDPLMSHLENIMEIKGTVKRAESMKNGYIVDEHYKSVSYSQITTKRFPNSMNQDSFILMTVG